MRSYEHFNVGQQPNKRMQPTAPQLRGSVGWCAYCEVAAADARSVRQSRLAS
jgi:hypothetical protein